METDRGAAEVAPPAPANGAAGFPAFDLNYAMQAAAEPADRSAAVSSVAAAAQFLRKREPHSPAPYLMLRGLRWGELRASSDPAVLEAPPTEIRRQIRAWP